MFSLSQNKLCESLPLSKHFFCANDLLRVQFLSRIIADSKEAAIIRLITLVAGDLAGVNKLAIGP
jgi:hypothetical protein